MQDEKALFSNQRLDRAGYDLPFRGDRIAILTRTRHAAEAFVAPFPYAVISIRDLGALPACLRDDASRRGILWLAFADVCCAPTEVESCREAYRRKGQHRFFLPEDALRICDFVEAQLRQGIKLLVIHCEGGVSRSPAIAACLSEWLNGDIGPWEMLNGEIAAIMRAEIHQRNAFSPSSPS